MYAHHIEKRQIRLQEQASVKIQAAFRGYATRQKLVTNLRRLEMEEITNEYEVRYSTAG